jgi:hypothetical protein
VPPPQKTTATQTVNMMAVSVVLDEENGPMKRLKFSEEQIVYTLRQPNSGTPIGDLCRQLGGVSCDASGRWRKKIAG